jgi:ribosomal protein S18 acetylase RimI-like enzyme
MGTKLLKHVEEYATKNGYKHLVCDTAENAKGLIDYYSKRGYRFIDYVKWNHTNYRSVVLAKELKG